MIKLINNIVIRIISSFILNQSKRKAFRQRYLIDKRAFLLPVSITGNNNKIIIIKNGKEYFLKNGDKLFGIKLKITGNNNTVKLIYPIKFNGSTIEIIYSNNAYVEVNPSPQADGLHISMAYGNNQKIIIGENTTFCGLKITAPSNSSCIIGKNCMFAEFVKCWCGDCHMIMDKTTGELLNPDPEALVIGNHCWIGESSRLLKNTILPDNTIVAACSVVTKNFKQENMIIGGTPAKILRKNVVWSRENQCTKNLEPFKEVLK